MSRIHLRSTFLARLLLLPLLLIALAASLSLCFSGSPSLTFAMASLGSPQSSSGRSGSMTTTRFVPDLKANGKIAFSSTRDGNHEVYVMDADGSNQIRITNNPAYDDQPRWSPDGAKIAFISNRDGNFEIYSMNADGNGQTRLTNNLPADGFPAWSPDGTKIVFVSGDLLDATTFEIYVINADGSNRTRLTNNAVMDAVPAWSPDGTKIVFMSGSSFFDPNSFDIYAMDANGNNRTLLTNNSIADGQPAWSPDGTKILFASGDAMNPSGIEIYVMNANGTNRTQLTNNSVTDGFPAWSPDGAKIVFASGSVSDEKGVELYAMNADGSNPTQLTSNSVLDWFPDWQPIAAAMYSVSGRVADGSNNGVSDVTITFELSFQGTISTRTTLTDSGGNYSFSDPACQNRAKVTPSKTGYSFSPLSIAFVSTGCVSGSNTANFTATPPPPNTVQFSSAGYSIGEGGGSATISVTRSGDTSHTSSVDYQTADNFNFVECNVNNGLANQRCDYITTAGTLNFAADETSKTFSVPIVDDSQVESNETLNLSLGSPVGGTLGSQSTAVLTINDNDTTAPATRLFIAQLTAAQETPPTTSTATGLGTLLLSSDEMSAQVNLSFSGLSSAQTEAHIHGPAHVEVAGSILFPLPTGTVNNQTINLTATQVAQLKAGLFYFNVHTDNFIDGEIRGQILPNPLENARFFVRQQYYDLQNREPDQGGWDYWTKDANGGITSCNADLLCITARRVAVADAFFFEPEFQQTGSYVFRLYRAAYGNTQPRANPEIPQLPSHVAFIQDRARVNPFVGDVFQLQLALANAFVQRAEFLAKYPASLSGPQFVDALLATILTDSGANLSSQRDTLIAHFNTGGRGLVLFHLANDYWNSCGLGGPPCAPPGFGPAVDNRPFLDAEYSRTFVATMYFDFLRRDADIGGYVFWLGQVNSFPLRSTVGQHKMVCGALITSVEYQQRFSTYFTRSDAECGPIQ